MLNRFLTNKKRLARLAFFLVFDAIFIALSVYFAFFLRFEGQIPSRYFLNIGGIIFLALLITLPIFYFFKLYAFSWAYVGAEELISLAKAVSLSFLILTAAFFILREHPIFTGFPRSALFITYFFIFIFCGWIRFLKRFYLQIVRTQTKENKERTLIVGAGDAGEQLLRSIISSKESHYLPVGFIDDNPAKQGVIIHGLRVLGKLSDISRLTRRERIENLIIALPSAGSRAIREAVEGGRKAGLRKIKIVPPISELIGGESDLGNLREVQIADLLGREPVALDTRAIENFIQNKTVLITGAAGSIGSELCRQAAKFRPSQLLLLDQDETGIFNISEELEDRFPKLKIASEICDIRDREKIERIFNKFRPGVIFHAAAYKHVPLMEIHPDEAVKNNIFGTGVVAESAIKYGGEKFVFISCLDEKTRILTNEGLKWWNEVKSGMKTLSLNYKGEIEENEIEEVVFQNYSGPMFQIKTRSIDMLVTPNHKMIIQLPNNSAKIIEEQTRKTVKRSGVYIPKGKWKGINEEWFSLSSPPTDIRHPLRNCPTKVKTEDILYLLGIFIGDGFLNSGYKRQDGRKTDNNGSVFFDIPEKDKARKRILATLDRMGVTYKCYKGKAGEHIYFSSRALAQVFSACGRGAKNKTIPDWALKYSLRLLQSLLDGLIDSDGYWNGSRQKLTSVSLKLMEKCAELATKLGLHFTVSIQRNKETMIGNRKILSSQSFVGIFSRTKHRAFTKKHCKQVNYQGVIWCVRVKNNHNFLAERNGKFFFTGNTDKSVNPTSVMGATKRAGEMICQSLNKRGPTKFISVRFGNVLASRGSVIPIFEEKIKKREALEVTHPEMKRYFMTSAEACLLVLQASQMGKGGEVFVLDMGEPIRILDLAKEMICLSGLEPDKDIPIVITQPRPGEKFFEETLTAEEGTEATYHQKIFIAKLSENIDENKLNFILKKIKIEAEAGKTENIKKNLKEIIPTYKPYG
ncbi:polysaccharide biosynthesis protein [Patescibacteria group bacterium]|nr:polysaccharide biosynthesis protein [Patescibacteria group bacterium]